MSGSRLRLVLAPLLMALFAPTALAQSTSPASVYVVTYVETLPSAKDDVATLLTQWSETARKDEGNLGLNVLQGSLRPNQFVIVGAWKDQKALEGDLAAPHTNAVREKMRPHLLSPNDGRTHTGFAVGPAPPARPAGAVYVVTHVDVPPPSRADCEALLRRLAEDSRKDDGNIRFDVYQQINRPNHFTVLEVWKDQNARDGHAAAAHVKQFREKLGPILGALYDDRFYRAID